MLSVGIDESARYHNGYVCTSRECAQISGFFANNINDKISSFTFFSFHSSTSVSVIKLQRGTNICIEPKIDKN